MIATRQPSPDIDQFRVCALIVTYNRLALLKAAVSAVRAQTVVPETILVLDNGSTDGTAAWLREELGADRTGRLRVIHQANKGCTDGFATGLKEAFTLGHDWFWCMDDDTIPDRDCLENLLLAATSLRRKGEAPQIGWLNSVVRWTDGELHRMNEPKVESFLSWGHRVLQNRALPSRWCSYVSLLIARDAVATCGLPLRNMFIWYDDVEYTSRITGAGYSGWIVLDSGAEHRTAKNYVPDLSEITPQTIPRFRYAFRNRVVALRRLPSRNRLVLAIRFGRLMLRQVCLLIKYRRIRYIPVAVVWGCKGLFFDLRPESAGAIPATANGRAAAFSAIGRQFVSGR